MAGTISSLKVELFRVPLDEVLEDALHGSHSIFELITVTLSDSQGCQGTGYTYTGGKGGKAIHALIDTDLRVVVIGQPLRRAMILENIEKHVHYVGRGGIASFATSAVDIALWDLELKKAGMSLWRAVGGKEDTCRCYRGGIDLGYSQEKLVESVRGYLKEGHDAVKIKVGLPDMHEDISRIAAVREELGPLRTMMVDANMTWSCSQAVQAAKLMAPYNLTWLEEPTAPGDYKGYRRIRAEGGLALAQGENLHTLEDFRHALEVGGVDHPQPDASNCGGITGWIKVAAMAEAFGLKMSSHGMHELHVNLVAGVANGGWLEVHSFPIHKYTMEGLVVERGRAKARDQPGIGVTFNWELLREYSIQE